MNCAVSACAAPGQSCVYDPSCAAGGFGCNAGGLFLCRFCGFGIFSTIRCAAPAAAAPPSSRRGPRLHMRKCRPRRDRASGRQTEWGVHPRQLRSLWRGRRRTAAAQSPRRRRRRRHRHRRRCRRSRRSRHRSSRSSSNSRSRPRTPGRGRAASHQRRSRGAPARPPRRRRRRRRPRPCPPTRPTGEGGARAAGRAGSRRPSLRTAPLLQRARAPSRRAWGQRRMWAQSRRAGCLALLAARRAPPPPPLRTARSRPERRAHLR